MEQTRSQCDASDKATTELGGIHAQRALLWMMKET